MAASMDVDATAMEVEYELAQQLTGHENQVRCVCPLGDDTLITGGLDAQILVWKRPSPGAPFAAEPVKSICLHSDWVNDLAASFESPGSFYSASKDRTALRIDPDGNPVRQ